MKKAQVQIGQRYICKVSGRLAEVRIDSECPYGGWWAVSTQTGRQVRIRSAQRLRAPAAAILRRREMLAGTAADGQPAGKEERDAAQQRD